MDDNINMKTLDNTKNSETITRNYKKLSFYSWLLAITIIIFVIITDVFGLFNTFKKNNDLVMRLEQLIIEDCIIFLVCFSVVINIFIILNKKNKILIKTLAISVVLLLGYNILNIQRGTQVSMLNYSVGLFKDIISNETTTSKSNSVLGNALNKRWKNSVSYISYKVNGNTENFSSKEAKELGNIVNKLNVLENEILIEYYEHSRVIKSIDGIDKFDYEKLNERINTLTLQKKEKELNEQNEYEEGQKQKLEEYRNQISIQNEIKEKAVGMNIEELKKELNENNTKEYSIKYISSKLGQVNTVVFVDNIKFCFYVIRDNDYEEMTSIPNLQLGMNKENIVKLLQEEGLSCNFYEATHTTDKNKIDTLCTYTYSPGTLVPKGIEVGIGLYTYEK